MNSVIQLAYTTIRQADAAVAEQRSQEMLDRLQKEFDEWWEDSPLKQWRRPETSGTQWTAHPDQPITHWPNVEDFLRERYPDATTNAERGVEDAFPSLQAGYGNDVTAAMLDLHNQAQSRGWLGDEYQRLLYKMMLRDSAIRLALKTIHAAEETTGPPPRILYHLTDNPNFQLDPEIEPQAALTIPEIRMGLGPGIYMTSDPDYWAREHQYIRPYVAEIEVPEPIWGRDQWEKQYGNYGPEVFIPASMYDKLKVRRVRPYQYVPPKEG